jgi:hypothetical protein
MQTAVLDQTRLEINEWLLCLDFKCRRVAIAAERHRMNVLFPIEVGAKNQRPCFRWVTKASVRLNLRLVGCVISSVSVRPFARLLM